MKKILLSIIIAVTFASCDVDYETNPNQPKEVISTALFNNSTVSMIYRMNDQWWAGRFTLLTMEYWAQTAYTNEGRYEYRDNVYSYWKYFYRAMEDYRTMIELNKNEGTKKKAAMYGPNEGQIALCRIMLAYGFDIMASTYGDIPYYSYGTDNKDFQALKGRQNILSPKYAKQEDIFVDILKELSEAQDQLVSLSGKKIKEGDPIYGGDLDLWRKFANSLRMRIGLKLIGTSQDKLAKDAINDAITDGVFTSNDDNANLKFENNDKNGAPMYRAFYVGNRRDFAVAHPFIKLLKGQNLIMDAKKKIDKTNPFIGLVDPRLPIFADYGESSTMPDDDNKVNEYFLDYPSIDPKTTDKYIGQPCGIDDTKAKNVRWGASPPGKAILAIDFAVPLMDYSEVEFILSEYRGWDQGHYEKAVKASLEKWGVKSTDTDKFVSSLPAASQETVLTQKYIALYMQSHQAWTEYRRTGYPKFLVLPNESYSVNVGKNEVKRDKDGKLIKEAGNVKVTTTDLDINYTFTPKLKIKDIPSRVKYDKEEQNLNGSNYKEAVGRLSNGDELSSKLWWDIN